MALGAGFPGIRGDPSNEQTTGPEEESIGEEEGATIVEDARYRKVARNHVDKPMICSYVSGITFNHDNRRDDQGLPFQVLAGLDGDKV